MHVRGTELIIVIVLFVLVSGMGFVASRWRRASADSLEEWALAGRGFRSWLSWFVVGGDLYTAYTYVAVPALLFGSGAIGFYALPYVAMEYPIVFLIMIRLWSVCKAHGYITAADFVRARFGSPTLALAVAVVYIPYKLGGWTHIFNAYNAHFKTSPTHTGTLLTSANQLQYVTLALGSAFAIFLYPHAITGVITTRNRAVVKRTMAALPIYSFVLGLIALFGVMAIAGKITPLTGANGKPDTNTVVPSLFEHIFPHWFAGLAFAMIVIGALVPAAFMSIAAANLFTRNIYREYLRRDAPEHEQAQVSKIVSLVVKGGALLFILLIQPQFSIDLQLLGGAIILQTLPSVMIGLYTRWLHRGALIAGWAAGLIVSTWTFYLTPNPALKEPHWGGTAFALSHLGLDTKVGIYIGFTAVLVNLAVAVAGTAILKALKTAKGTDQTSAPDYFTDVADVPAPAPALAAGN